MSAQHTRGRLTIDDAYTRIAKAADGSDIFLTHEYGNAEANARRLVACWNALEDLPQAALDGGWTRAGLEAHAQKMEQQARQMQAQRDELLAVLSVLQSHHMAAQARAAIAKVEGEKQ